MRSKLRTLSCVAAVAVTASCVVYNFSAQSMTPEEAVGTEVRTPLKAFHADGTITVFRGGARVTQQAVFGAGLHYTLSLDDWSPVDSIPLDDLVGIEAFQGGRNAAASVLLTGVAIVGVAAVVALGAIAIACANDPKCFGSCPTVYTYEDGEEVLEAEAFSYSIAPLLEGRDVDRLGARPDSTGAVHLEIRNEALETHYINHVELLEARHAAGREAYPNEDGRVVSVGPVIPPSSARDRDGSDRTRELAARDDLVFASTEARIRSVTAEDYFDHIELTFPRPVTDSAALVLRLRNSLLNSVLFYDLMLGSRGAEALDWLGSGMNRIGEAVELGRWFQETMGLRVSVMGPDGWHPVTRVGDTGPIAWKELAVTVPVPDTEELRIRLTFLADEWRIDRVALAQDVALAEVEPLPVASVSRIGSAPSEQMLARLAEPDEDYLITSAGTALSLEFRSLPEHDSDRERTFFLSSQGYYTEWIRPQWIRSAAAKPDFRPSADVVVELMARWLEEKDEFEQKFFETRIPVR